MVIPMEPAPRTAVVMIVRVARPRCKADLDASANAEAFGVATPAFPPWPTAASPAVQRHGSLRLKTDGSRDHHKSNGVPGIICAKSHTASTSRSIDGAKPALS
jgi:hypothetical protein